MRKIFDSVINQDILFILDCCYAGAASRSKGPGNTKECKKSETKVFKIKSNLALRIPYLAAQISERIEIKKVSLERGLSVSFLL